MGKKEDIAGPGAVSSRRPARFLESLRPALREDDARHSVGQLIGNGGHTLQTVGSGL